MVYKNKPKHPCSVCDKNVSKCSKALLCMGKCAQWTHFKCSSLSLEEYNEIAKNKNWCCEHCAATLIETEDEDNLFISKSINKELVETVDSLNKIVETLQSDLEEAQQKIKE